MKGVYLPLAAVAPAVRILRKHDKAPIKDLAAGIERYGFNAALLVDDPCGRTEQSAKRR